MMDRLVLFALLTGNIVVMGTNPGLKLKLSEAGLNYAASVAIEQLSSEVKGQIIPDQSGSAGTPIGKVEYSVTSMHVTGFTPPASSIVVTPNSGISWSLTNIGISLHGDWRYKYRKAFIKISDHGSFDADVSGVSVQVAFSMGVDGSGRPTIATKSCNSGIGDVSVKFHGGASWLYNLFRDNIEKPIRDRLQSMLCDVVTKAINTDANKALADMKVQIPIEGLVTLDYSLVAPPSFINKAIEFSLKGEFFWTGITTEAPFQPEPLAEDPGDLKMVTFFLSDYALNTLGYVLFTHGSQFMSYNLTKKDLPASAQHYLDTTLIPVLHNKYPNGSIELDMRITAAPNLLTSPNVTKGHFQGQINFRVRLPSGILAEGFVVQVDANASLAVSLTGNHITAKIENFRFKNTISQSAVGPIPEALIDVMFKVIADSFIIPQLNVVGAKGFDLPKINHVDFVDPQLTLSQGCIIFATNAKYTPGALLFKSKHKPGALLFKSKY